MIKTERKRYRAGFKISAARLAAIQALYELYISSGNPKAVLEAFNKKRWRPMTLRDPDTKPGRGGKARLPNPDEEYLSSIVYGVLNQSQKYEDKIENVLEKKWSVSRLDVLMRALLNAASYEIAERKEIPTGILIVEYTDLAHVFFDDKDASFAAMVINQMTIDR